MSSRCDIQVPFDSRLLDRLLESAGIDVLLVTSKHNIQYLLGGYRYFFFDRSDALGVSRYLPILIYPRGRPETASYVGNTMEVSEVENGRFWMAKTDTTTWRATDAMHVATAHVRELGGALRIGLEHAFMPADAAELLRQAFPDSEMVEGHFALERLRAVKTPPELTLLREASDRVIASMLATVDFIRPGMTKAEVVAELRRQEFDRGMDFEYCLITAGTSLNRAPSSQPMQESDIFSLDSGGRYQGYIGDLCRMGILGQPDDELRELLAEVEAVQQAARTALYPGARGDAAFTVTGPILSRSRNRDTLHFVAHGMGIIGHEAPRLSADGPVTYDAYDADRPLEPGMVISVETTLLHPRRGFIKIEDTLAITADGFEAYGDGGRGWNIAAAA